MFLIENNDYVSDIRKRFRILQVFSEYHGLTMPLDTPNSSSYSS